MRGLEGGEQTSRCANTEAKRTLKAPGPKGHARKLIQLPIIYAKAC